MFHDGWVGASFGAGQIGPTLHLGLSETLVDHACRQDIANNRGFGADQWRQRLSQRSNLCVLRMYIALYLLEPSKQC